MNHGTRYGYLEGCRCDPCTAANTAYRRVERAKNPPAYPQWRRLRQWPLAPLVAMRPDARDALGVSSSAWSDANIRGLSDRNADRWACRLGLHPGVVWEGWWEAGLAVSDDQFVNGSPGAEPGWRQAAGYAA